MQRAALWGLPLLLLFFFFSGCGDTPYKCMRDYIDLTNEQAEILESIDSKEAAENAKPRLKELLNKAKEVELRADKLKISELAKAKIESLDKKIQEELTRAMQRKDDAMTRVSALFRASLPGGPLPGGIKP